MNNTWRPLIILSLLAAAVTMGGCGGKSHSETKKEEAKLVVPVEIDSVTLGDIAAFFTGTATIEAEQETEVVAKVGGVVERIMVEEGQFVRAGQVLAKLDDEMISVQLDQAAANLKKLESRLDVSLSIRGDDLFLAG